MSPDTPIKSLWLYSDEKTDSRIKSIDIVLKNYGRSCDIIQAAWSRYLKKTIEWEELRFIQENSDTKGDISGTDEQ